MSRRKEFWSAGEWFTAAKQTSTAVRVRKLKNWFCSFGLVFPLILFLEMQSLHFKKVMTFWKILKRNCIYAIHGYISGNGRILTWDSFIVGLFSDTDTLRRLKVIWVLTVWENSKRVPGLKQTCFLILPSAQGGLWLPHVILKQSSDFLGFLYLYSAGKFFFSIE